MVRSQKTTSFKYVTVEQDDSELVIMAGSREPDSVVAAPCDDAGMPAYEQAKATEKSASATKSSKPLAEKPADAADDGYRETTLDDLDHEPMSKMQRAVLLGIAVLVIVFIAYVLFF